MNNLTSADIFVVANLSLVFSIYDANLDPFKQKSDKDLTLWWLYDSKIKPE
jgi:hypothetical protein